MVSLKTVSGRLKEFFWGRDQTAIDRVEKTPGNLLVVDDEESICFSMSEYFSQHGFKVDTAREKEEAEGQGIGGTLARAALDFARAEKLKVVPMCQFIAAFIKRHHEYRDLVPEEHQHRVK